MTEYEDLPLDWAWRDLTPEVVELTLVVPHALPLLVSHPQLPVSAQRVLLARRLTPEALYANPAFDPELALELSPTGLRKVLVSLPARSWRLSPRLQRVMADHDNAVVTNLLRNPSLEPDLLEELVVASGLRGGSLSSFQTARVLQLARFTALAPADQARLMEDPDLHPVLASNPTISTPTLARLRASPDPRVLQGLLFAEHVAFPDLTAAAVADLRAHVGDACVAELPHLGPLEEELANSPDLTVREALAENPTIGLPAQRTLASSCFSYLIDNPSLDPTVLAEELTRSPQRVGAILHHPNHVPTLEHSPSILLALRPDALLRAGAGVDPRTFWSLVPGWVGTSRELLAAARSLGPA